MGTTLEAVRCVCEWASLEEGRIRPFMLLTYSKTCLKRPLKKNCFYDRLSLNAGQKYCRMLQGEHSAILSTFINLQLVIKIFVLSIFERLLKTGLTVTHCGAVSIEKDKLIDPCSQLQCYQITR